MRLKNVWNFVPIPAKLKLFADRITLSKLTIFYFVFSILHCLIQVVFQVEAFKINENAANFLNSVIVQGNVSEAGFTVLKGNELRWCTSVPHTFNASQCQVVWDGAKATNATSAFLDNGSQNQVVNLPDYVASLSSVSSSSSTSATSATSVATSSSQSHSSSSSSSSTSAKPTSSSHAGDSQADSTPILFNITDIGNLQSALESLEAQRLAAPTTSDVPVVTVTVKPLATASSSPAVVDHEHKRAIADSTKVISTLAVNGTKQVKVLGLPGHPNEEVTLSESCLVALNWPLTRVDNTKREDIVFIGFSFWVLGMSLVALLNESPPHIVASFLTHCLATGWSAFQLVNTQSFRKDFTRLATTGACGGVNLLPTYWNQRAQFEIPTLAFNALALIISAVLSWKLMKSFGWQTFKRIGASLSISRAYRIILIFSIVIQLSVFFVVVSVALWVDQIYNGDIGHLTKRPELFKGIMIGVLFLMLPWLTIGWISVRREQKIPMIVFLVLSLGYTVGWSSMFTAATFRWTYVEWLFFSLMATASVVLALATFILGIICTCNFKKGVKRYLNAQEPLPGDDFEPAHAPSSSPSFFADKQWGGDEEKVDFPSYNTSIPIPTFAQVPAPPPAYAQTAQRTLGPRFYQGNMGMPFDQRPAMNSDVTMVSQSGESRIPLTRQKTNSSIGSMGSLSSESSVPSTNMRGKRWVIE